MRLSRRGWIELAESGPLDPTISGRSRRSASARTGTVAQLTHRLTSLFMLPSQLKRVASKWAGPPVSRGSKGTSCWVMAIAVPSFGAALAMVLITSRPPPPGRLRGTTTGAPGK